jgi:hypothetical protein
VSAFPKPPAETATLELLGRIHDGDEAAWTELYRAYHHSERYLRLERCLEGLPDDMRQIDASDDKRIAHLTKARRRLTRR